MVEATAQTPSASPVARSLRDRMFTTSRLQTRLPLHRHRLHSVLVNPLFAN